jgi:hypothetical protein
LNRCASPRTHHARAGLDGQAQSIFGIEINVRFFEWKTKRLSMCFGVTVTSLLRKSGSHTGTFLAQIKPRIGRSDAAAQNEAGNSSHHLPELLSNDSEVLRLASDGLNAFVVRSVYSNKNLKFSTCMTMAGTTRRKLRSVTKTDFAFIEGKVSSKKGSRPSTPVGASRYRQVPIPASGWLTNRWPDCRFCFFMLSVGLTVLWILDLQPSLHIVLIRAAYSL